MVAVIWQGIWIGVAIVAAALLMFGLAPLLARVRRLSDDINDRLFNRLFRTDHGVPTSGVLTLRTYRMLAIAVAAVRVAFIVSALVQSS